MASGHVNRANRPNTWPQPTSRTVKKTLANGEPSTHGTMRTSTSQCHEVCLPIQSGHRTAKARRQPRAKSRHPADRQC
jgi:hypothetical protein